MASESLTMTAPPEVYRARRAKLSLMIHRPLVILAGHAPARNYATNPYPFRGGSSYLYFGGPPLEDAALVIEPHRDPEVASALFRAAPGPDDDLWLGSTADAAALAAAAGLHPSRIVDIDKLGRRANDLHAAAVAPPCPVTDRFIAQHRLKRAEADDLEPIIQMRLTKDEHELQAMRRAANVTVEAHRAAIAACAPGRREADAAAAYYAVLEANLCRPAFTPIVSVRGEVLHDEGHRNELNAGDLLLIDAGAEGSAGYAADVTRVCPVSGEFTPIQRHLYDTVKKALHEAVAACVPGKRYREVHFLAARVICEGLVSAELLRGDPAELAERSAHTLFFPHGVGHLIGIEVHDMEDFGDQAGYAPGRQRSTEFGTKFLRLDRDLQPGMTVTIEPGIYFVPAIWARDDLVDPLTDCVNRSKVDALLNDRFGGIRLEDTICVRHESAGGPENLSATLELDADSIANLVGRES